MDVLNKSSAASRRQPREDEHEQRGCCLDGLRPRSKCVIIIQVIIITVGEKKKTRWKLLLNAGQGRHGRESSSEETLFMCMKLAAGWSMVTRSPTARADKIVCVGAE